MVALQIRDVPESVRDALALRAKRSGQSLQGYLLGVVTREAEFARNTDLVQQIGDWADESGVTAEDTLAALDAARVSAGPA